jgi:phosphotransferase system enzyme I (PtsI)
LALAESTILQGLGVGLRSAVGEVWRVFPQAKLPAWTKTQTNKDAATAALRNAIAAVAADLDTLGARAGGESVEIFDALKVLLEDEELFAVASSNLDEGWRPAAAFGMAVNTFAELLEGDSAFAERVADLQDLSKRVQANLAGISMTLDLPQTGNIVLVGDDFSPADTAQFTAAVVGVVTINGGPTSHTSIICRSRSIPAVVSVAGANELQNGQQVLVDPVGDRVVVSGTVSDSTSAIEFVALSDEPIIPVRSNIGTLTDARAAAKTGADGVGLFRTELLYLNEKKPPSIEQQTAAFVEILNAAPSGPVVVRTIDAGGDKPVPFLPMSAEENPSLGVRGYRLIHEHRWFIEDQLKALEAARVASGRDVWVMAPMISSVPEAKEFCDLARSIGQFKVGIMVETPSISVLVADLKSIVDFISIGTNDLSQYLFAADRMNPGHGKLLTPWQPGLIRTLALIAAAGKTAGIPVGVCGESASDPLFAVVLAGLGVTAVSASPSQVDVVRTALSSVNLEQAKMVADRALAATSPEAAKENALNALAE